MRALLLAAGYGTRLRPLTDTVPKCLVPIRDKALLGYWFDLLFPAGVEAAIVNTHYLAGRVREFVSASKWCDRIKLVHEESLLGTGGTILHNRRLFGGQPFMVAHADNLTHFNVDAFIACHLRRPTGIAITMMTFDSDDPQSAGIVVEDEHGIVREFHEKVSHPPGNRANAAVYIFEPEIHEFLTELEQPVIDLSTDVLPRYLGRICTFHNTDYHRDIGSPESLMHAELEFRPT